MSDERQKKFVTYLNERKEQSLDTVLTEYLQQIRSSFVKNELSEDDLVRICGELMILLPMHLSRKHIDLIRQGGALAVIHGFGDVSLGTGYTVSEILEDRLKSSGLMSPLIWALPDPVSIAGYDPRFVRRDGVPNSICDNTKAIYKNLLDGAKSIAADSFDYLDFFGSYAQAKSSIYRDFHDSARRYDLLLIDLSWLPELAYQGNILPLERFDPSVKSNLSDRLAPYFDDDAHLRFWTEIASDLTRGGNDSHYGLPLFLNTHCRLSPKDSKLGEREARYEEITRGELQGASIQTKHSASCVYQLFAHFAYTGAEPVKVTWAASATPRASVNFSTPETLRGFALMLARLYILDDQGRRFGIGHEDEVAGLNIGRWTWSPAFNSELARRKPKHLNVGAPFKAKGKPRWLASVGGYALAISSKSVDPVTTYRFALEFHKCALEKGSKEEKWTAIPIEAREAFAAVDHRDYETFIRIHSRPRVPFWTHIEELISFAVQEIATLLETDIATKEFKVPTDKDHLGEWADAVFDWLGKSGKGIPAPQENTLSLLGERVKLCFTNNGWSVE